MWEKIPGVTQQDVEAWKTMAAEPSALERLMAELAAANTKPPTIVADGPVG